MSFYCHSQNTDVKYHCHWGIQDIGLHHGLVLVAGLQQINVDVISLFLLVLLFADVHNKFPVLHGLVQGPAQRTKPKVQEERGGELNGSTGRTGKVNRNA